MSGRFAAKVIPKVIRLENNRVDLIFEVNEGELIKIESIRFIGNEAFSDFALRQVISSRKRRWWAFMSGADKYDPADSITMSACCVSSICPGVMQT